MEKRKIKTKPSETIHCPHAKCLYFEGSTRYFTSRRLLNQHILKVHAEKKFRCEKCQKGYGSEWQQRHHERTCGIQWLCSCGHKYNCRETLLTHHRRTQHPLPQGVAKPRSIHSAASNPVETNSQPMQPRFLLVPINQSLNFGGQPMNTTTTFQSQLVHPENVCLDSKTPVRKILPKFPSTLLSPGPLNVSNSAIFFLPDNNLSKVDTAKNQDFQTPQTVGTQTDLNESILPAPKRVSSVVNTEKTIAGTQTGRLPLESRASQCSPRTPTNVKSRRRGYRGTSIETQTVESIVGRIKSTLNSKSRVSTKPMKSDREAQSVWSCLNKLLTSTLSRSSSGTQTSPRGKINRTTCASQTLTEDRRAPSSEQTAHEMLGLLATVCQHLKDNTGSKESALSSLQTMMTSSLGEYVVSRKDGPEVLNNDLLNTIIPCLAPAERYEQFSLEEPVSVNPLGDLNIDATVPILSTIETQTATINCPDLFSTNMETQTTDDIFLSELELSHIQTQTPWDFLDFCDDLNPNQLSADIQTDITGEEFKDIFEDALWNTNAGTSLADVTDMETQTHSFLPSMELISSYTQTLDDSLKIELPVPIIK